MIATHADQAQKPLLLANNAQRAGAERGLPALMHVANREARLGVLPAVVEELAQRFGDTALLSDSEGPTFLALTERANR